MGFRTTWVKRQPKEKAAIGFEPMNRGFAIRSLSPLGHAAKTPADPPVAGGKIDTYIVRFDNGQVQTTRPRPARHSMRKWAPTTSYKIVAPTHPRDTPGPLHYRRWQRGLPRWEPGPILKAPDCSCRPCGVERYRGRTTGPRTTNPSVDDGRERHTKTGRA